LFNDNLKRSETVFPIQPSQLKKDQRVGVVICRETGRFVDGTLVGEHEKPLQVGDYQFSGTCTLVLFQEPP
jgi:hypothetical protein